MAYTITCTCGEDISVDAASDDEAVTKLKPAMDEHVSATAHPDIPADLSDEQKESMIRSTMKKSQ